MFSHPLMRVFLLAGALLLGVSACSPLPGSDATPTFTPLPTETPTVTLVPMAVIVNGEGITQAEFETELWRFQQADEQLGLVTSPEDAARIVLDDFIDQLLLVKGAGELGYVIDDTALQARIDALAAVIGGPEQLAAWQAQNGYTDADFRTALRRQVTAAWMRDQVITAVPTTADQVHVKQILFYNAADAQNVYALLQSGWNFNDLAAQYDPITKGELGWFPRGYLVHPTIEEAAFALQPGGYSAVIESSVGFHLLYLVERDPAHLLSPDALLTLQEHALQGWLTDRRNASTIVVAP